MTLRRDDPERRARWEWRQRHPILTWLSRLDSAGWQLLIFGPVLVVGSVVALIAIAFGWRP